jgi:hypothetical protein
MGDIIYVPTNRGWCDSPRICLTDLFPGKTVPEANEIMIQAADMMEVFLINKGQKTLGVKWMNRLERFENPDGTMGFFRLYPRSIFPSDEG